MVTCRPHAVDVAIYDTTQCQSHCNCILNKHPATSGYVLGQAVRGTQKLPEMVVHLHADTHVTTGHGTHVGHVGKVGTASTAMLLVPI